MLDTKSQNSNMLLAFLTLTGVIAIVALVGFFMLRKGPEIVQGQAEVTEYRVSSKVPGRILEFRVKEGQSVQAGDTLAILEAPDVQAKLEQARAAEAAAQAQNEKALKGARREQIQAAYEMWQKAQAGLAIAEMIASLSIPTVSLVLGGGHSIGVPMAVSADYSFAVPSATMVIHPVRSSGMFIGVAQTYRNMEKIQDRITGFIAAHSRASQERLEELMLDTSQLVKDVGTLLEGEEAVKEGLIDEIGGIREALAKLHEMIEAKNNKI